MDTGLSNKNITFTSLVKVFMPYINKRASRIRLVGVMHEDIVQEGLIGLLNAIEAYDETRGSSFESFAISCIDNRIISALRQAATKSNAPFTDYMSLSEHEEEIYSFFDLPHQPSPEDVVIMKEELAAVLSMINENLSIFEKKVLALYLEGYSYIAIGEILHTSTKSIDNALQRARKKLK
ncbi:MAG: sigma-70 family RNA polymerase sigma factor [Oscillospiraceae bacterium]|nr:sigma-70 family RNA polymerase sigma factor [Oscillospiraceae bacterium]